jgi:hypothetical protein
MILNHSSIGAINTPAPAKKVLNRISTIKLIQKASKEEANPTLEEPMDELERE